MALQHTSMPSHAALLAATAAANWPVQVCEQGLGSLPLCKCCCCLLNKAKASWQGCCDPLHSSPTLNFF